MNKTVVAGIVIALAFFSAVWMTSVYNQVHTLDENVDKQWAQVQNVYQRRADLIPNLIEVVKGYATYESETIKAIQETRNRATGVTFTADNLTEENIKKFQEAQAEVSAGLNKLLVVVENYPELKAKESFQELQAQLEGSENRITVERKKYNEAVMELNAHIRKFPGSFANTFIGIQPRPYFETNQGVQDLPKVDF